MGFREFFCDGNWGLSNTYNIINYLHGTVAMILESGCDTNDIVYYAPRHAIRWPITEDLYEMPVSE
jgi:hypothetical protein